MCSLFCCSPSQEEKIRQGESRGEHGGSLGEGQITLPFGQGVLRSFCSSVMSLCRGGLSEIGNKGVWWAGELPLMGGREGM